MSVEVFNAGSSGAVPAGWDWIGYGAGTVPVTGLMGAMPFGPGPEVFLGWMWEGGGLEILQKAYDKYNVKVLPCHLTAPEPAGWFNKEIKTPEDFQGLKMRISGLRSEEHTSELQSLMRISYAVFFLKKKTTQQ